MKNLLKLFVLFFAFLANAQTPTFPISTFNNVKINSLIEGSKSDSLVVVGDDKVLRYLPVSGATSGLQEVTEEGNITTESVGIATSSIDTNVSLLKIGEGSPSDANNIIAITHSYNIDTGSTPGVGNNGLNLEVTGIAQSDYAGRAVRAIKSVAFVDPNGFNLTNPGGAAQGMEGVARVIGDNGGTVYMGTGGYWRVINQSSNVDLEWAVTNYLNNPLNTSTGTMDKAIGALIVDHAKEAYITHSADVLIGSPSNDIPTEFKNNVGLWGIYNMSPHDNYFNSNLGIGIIAPTEKLHVVGNSIVTGSSTVGSISVTGGSTSNYLRGDGSPAVFGASVQSSTIGTLASSNTAITSGINFKEAINRTQGQLDAIKALEVVSSVTTSQTASNLNTTYPSAPLFQKVYCPDITPVGAVYVKTTVGGQWMDISTGTILNP